MEKDLSDYRRSYEKFELLVKDAPKNPMELFENWFLDVDKFFPEYENNVMTISTLDLDGYPKSRIVLLKKYNQEGFMFYTNYKSAKGRAIDKNSNVCLSFFWHGTEQQVIIKGRAEKITKELSDDYFKSRPRGSQLGALVSKQSDILSSRDILEERLKELEDKYAGEDIERPSFWGGYVVKPIEIEFWQGRTNRLHDRINYTKTPDNSWSINRLYP